MRSAIEDSEFNARWMSPEQIAYSFIPVPEFQKLVHTNNAILLGPRGCGKTTLLKMLTRRAIDTWDKFRKDEFDSKIFDYPQFETIYIPSDSRWHIELKHIKDRNDLSEVLVERIQRLLITLSVFEGFLDTVRYSVNNIEDEIQLSKELIGHWELNSILPRFDKISIELLKIAACVRGAINDESTENIRKTLSRFPNSYFGHALDNPIIICQILEKYFKESLGISKWAICFDELEISPDWLRKELLTSLRSCDQRILLKLTSTPILPRDIHTEPARDDDFKPIRLWHSHVVDAKTFCEELTRKFIKDNYSSTNLIPDVLLNFSQLDNDEPICHPKVYEAGSPLMEIINELVNNDESFQELLKRKGIDQNKLNLKIEMKDKFWRKIRPFIGIRESLKKPDDKMRSRKVLTVYAGKEAIYYMSEANPRWLLNLLTNLYDIWISNQRFNEAKEPIIPFPSQRKVLSDHSNNFHSYIKTIENPESGLFSRKRLSDMVDRIGEHFKGEIHGKRFPIDPNGSFIVDEDFSDDEIKTIQLAIEKGVFIFVGKSRDDLPQDIRGNRFRLTYRLSPKYYLPFKNLPSRKLSEIMGKPEEMPDEKQITLEFDSKVSKK